MATPITAPTGWVKDGNNGYYSAEFRSVTKSSALPGANPNLDYAYSVNPQTGDRIVYAIAPKISTGLRNQVTGQSYDIGGSRTAVMSIDSTGKVTPLSGYTQIKQSFGDAGIQTLKNGSKDAAVNLMAKTNAASTATKQSAEYKSALDNATKQQATEAAGLKDIPNLKLEDSKGTRTSYGSNITYPIDLNQKFQDCLKFTMLKYEPTPLSAQNIATGGGFSSRSSNRNGLGSVILPIQSQVVDTNTVDWGGQTVNPMQAMGAAASAETIVGGGEGAQKSAQDLIKLVGGNKSDIQKAIAVSAAGEAVGAQNLLARTSGAILNPNMELLFNGPQLRQFAFVFRLSPRNKPEAENVRKIIRFFKQGMSVKRAASALFLKAPNTFSIQYLNKEKDHPYIGKIKECALLSCSVNYVPDQTYMTFQETPSMTSYEISMTFQELEPLYDDDYGNDDSNVGF
jgi:hypothetical protein